MHLKIHTGPEEHLSLGGELTGGPADASGAGPVKVTTMSRWEFLTIMDIVVPNT